jgi:hypothetical protein
VVLHLSISCEESCLLVSYCVGGRCGMTGSDEDCGRSRRPSAEDQRWSSTSQVLGGRTIERSEDAVCGLHRTQRDEECVFFRLASKPRLTVSPGLTLKPVASGFPVWTSKSTVLV